MSSYINDSKSSLKISTSFSEYPNQYYPSPNSPPPPIIKTEQSFILSHSSPVMLQQEQQQFKAPSTLEEWMLLEQNNINNHHNNNYNPHTMQHYTDTTWSEASSYGIRTPDIGITDVVNTTTPNPNMFGYAPYVQRHTMTEDIQLIPSLTQGDHMMLLQKGYSELQYMLYYEQPQDTLSQLSKEQLIERVVQLEMEKNGKIANNMRPSPRQDKTTQREQFNPCENDGEQIVMHSCLWASCTAQAPTLDRLMTHICENHIGSGKATYACDWQDCSRNRKPFMKRHKMHNHMRTHTGERPFVCTVIDCNKTFSRPDSLSTHIKTHSDIRPYMCQMPGCEKAYFHSRSLRKHIKSSHMKNASSARSTPLSTVTQRQPAVRLNKQSTTCNNNTHYYG